MSISQGENGAVHFPKRRDVFTFDEEIASCFPDMAVRSIPGYNEVHRVHVSLLKDELALPDSLIVDVGSSTGKFIGEICNQLHIDPSTGEGLNIVALDNSAPMLDKVAGAYPWVTCYHADLLDDPRLHRPATVMNMLYVLQFIDNRRKLQVLDWVYTNLARNGVLILGQKDGFTNSAIDNMFTAEYIRFREDNGYSKEEIEAKSFALRNSMWPIPNEDLTAMLKMVGFSVVTETTRWLNFSTLLCVK